MDISCGMESVHLKTLLKPWQQGNSSFTPLKRSFDTWIRGLFQQKC